MEENKQENVTPGKLNSSNVSKKHKSEILTKWEFNSSKITKQNLFYL